MALSDSTAGNVVEIFTDGSCLGNPGRGGWGALLRYRGVEKELSGAEAETTNNRMELMGAIMALEALTRPSDVQLSTDSAYVKNGITQWMRGWKRNGWRRREGKSMKPLKNDDLWKELDDNLASNGEETTSYELAIDLVEENTLYLRVQR